MEEGAGATSAGSDPEVGYRHPGNGAAPVAEHRVRTPLSRGGILAALGGVMVAAGTLFEMVSASIGPQGAGRVSISQSYVDTDNGKVAMALGIVAFVVAAAALVRSARSILWPIIVAAASLAALGIAVYDRIRLDDVDSDLRQRIYRDVRVPGVVQVSIGPALYIVIAGAVLATIGAVLASRDR